MVTQNIVQNVEHSFVTYSRLPLLTHAQSINDQHPTGKQGVELWCSPHEVFLHESCLKWHPLPSQNDLTRHASVRYGRAASPHTSRSLWKHSCVLRPRSTSILIQECYYSFVNMVLGRSHYPYESQRWTECSRLTDYCSRWQLYKIYRRDNQCWNVNQCAAVNEEQFQGPSADLVAFHCPLLWYKLSVQGVYREYDVTVPVQRRE